MMRLPAPMCIGSILPGYYLSCRVMADGKSLHADDDHLSEFGAWWISELFVPLFDFEV
jgi:hypothetical protein